VNARADSLHCFGAHAHDLAHVIAHLDLVCPLRLATLADERFIRVPSYPWQRSSYMLPRPTGDTASAVAPAPPPPPPQPIAPPPKLRAQLLGQAPATRRPPLVNYLQQRIGEALRMAPSLIDPQQALNTMGIDSLTAVEIKNRIEADLKVTVPVVKFLDGFAVGDFADLILDELIKVPGQVTTAPAAPPPAVQRTLPAKPRPVQAELDSTVAHLAIDQVDTLLAQLMKRTA
jgi:hypothetical protein